MALYVLKVPANLRFQERSWRSRFSRSPENKIIITKFLFREYPTGWMVSTQDRNWKFRVSIVYAKQEVRFLFLIMSGE